jgi:hypothetical protein
VSLSSDSRYVAYSGGTYIWAADIDGGKITLLAEGYSPVWQPQQG